jgi:hypothetical protein
MSFLDNRGVSFCVSNGFRRDLHMQTSTFYFRIYEL